MKKTETETIHLSGAKPCPFCGSTRIVKGERYFAMCVDCGATGPERNNQSTERKFVGDWNSRMKGGDVECIQLQKHTGIAPEVTNGALNLWVQSIQTIL
jgi:Lar family restriction alleviation protein